MNWKLKAATGVAAFVLATQAVANITFYEHDGYRGRTFTADRPVVNFAEHGFNDRASSVVVDRGRWEVCEHAYFAGRCVVLQRGSYESLSQFGMNDRISSARPLDDGARSGMPPPMAAPAPAPTPTYQYHRRPDERLYETPVESVRAVVGPPEQRCWIERQQVFEERGGAPSPEGAIAGAIIGGILGHQVGGGSGRDAATAAGVVAGAAIGANSGRGGGGAVTYDRDVQRCRTVASGRPEYWDVTYYFRGALHHVQMSAPPGETITVNGNGEPRM
jgi:uncharacterized protein YcfJ